MKLNKKKLEKAIPGSLGIISNIAKKCFCDWGTVDDFLKKPDNQDLQRMVEVERERILDLAESKVIKAINDDDIITTKWYLGLIGKRRGYIEKTESSVEQKGEFKIITEVIHRSKDEQK